MTLRVFIDEAGSFNQNEGKPSIVGAFATFLTDSELQSRLDKSINAFNVAHDTQFARKHVHIGPMLHPQGFTDKPDPYLASLPRETKETFVNSLKDTLKSFSRAFFVSVNDRVVFDATSAQSFYGDALLALVGEVKKFQHRETPSSPVELYIAARSPKCLPFYAEYEKYHDGICKMLKQPTGFETFIIEKGHPGESWADVACYFLRIDRKGEPEHFDSAKLFRTSLTRQVLQLNYGNPEEIFHSYLQTKNYLGAYKSSANASQRESIFASIRSLSTNDITSDILQSALHLTDEMIEQRTVVAGNLDSADILLAFLLPVAVEKLKTCTDQDKRKFAPVVASFYEQKLMIANHRGSVDDQKNIQHEYDLLQRDFSSDMGSLGVNRENILEFRNRAYNQEFNSFQFAPILFEFSDTVDSRLKEVTGSRDELAGKLAGTIGQAYAFESRTSFLLTSSAVEYLEKSLSHLTPGHRYHNMSVNYLTTLYWQAGSVEDALHSFLKHPYMPSLNPAHTMQRVKRLETLILAVLEARSHEATTPFDLLSLIRILAEEIPEQQCYHSIATGILKSCEKIIVQDHPWQLILKWLGVLFIKCQDYSEACKCLERAVSMSQTHGPTVRATVLPARGLLTIAALLQGDMDEFTRRMRITVQEADELTGLMDGFEDYLNKLGGTSYLKDTMMDKDIVATARWMPFTYA